MVSSGVWGGLVVVLVIGFVVRVGWVKVVRVVCFCLLEAWGDGCISAVRFLLVGLVCGRSSGANGRQRVHASSISAMLCSRAGLLCANATPSAYARQVFWTGHSPHFGLGVQMVEPSSIRP